MRVELAGITLIENTRSLDSVRLRLSALGMTGGAESELSGQGWEGSERSGHQLLATSHQPLASKSRPDTPCGRPRMNPSLTVGTRRDPLGISAWRSIAHRIEFSSRVPVHSVLVQKSVTTITNVAGRLSGLDARERLRDAQEGRRKKLAIDLPEPFVWSVESRMGPRICRSNPRVL